MAASITWILSPFCEIYKLNITTQMKKSPAVMEHMQDIAKILSYLLDISISIQICLE